MLNEPNKLQQLLKNIDTMLTSAFTAARARAKIANLIMMVTEDEIFHFSFILHISIV